MIKIINNISINLEENNGIYTIFSYERIIINPSFRKLISLPYYFNKKNDKYINFELNKDLILKGLSCLWNNLNEESSKNRLEFIIYNMNIDKENRNSPIEYITGSKQKIDIVSNTEFGRIFIS